MRKFVGAALAAWFVATPVAFAGSRCVLALVPLEGRETPAFAYFNATAVATGPTTGLVSWEPQPDALSYTVYLAGGDVGFFAAVGSTSESSLLVSGLRPGQEYGGYVEGTRASDDYYYRSTTIYIDTPNVPVPPVLAVPTIESFLAQPLGSGRVQFRFAVTGADKLNVEQRTPGGAWGNLVDIFGAATEFTKIDIPEGAKLEFRLVATNAAGSVTSETVALMTPPPATVDLTPAGTKLAVLTGGSTLRLFDATSGAELGVVAPFGSEPVGSVVLFDVNGDGVDDVVAGTGPGVPSRVRVVDGKTAREMFTVTPFEPEFLGGVSVAAGDVDGDGKAEVVAAAGPTGAPRVCVFDGAARTLEASFYPFDQNARGGASVTVGDFDGDGKTELLVGAGAGLAPEIKVLHWRDGAFVAAAPTLAFEPTFTGGVRVGVFDIDGNGTDEAIVAAGPGGAPRWRALNAADPDIELLGVFVGDSEARDGAFPIVVDGKPSPTLGALLPTVTFDPSARLVAASRAPRVP